VVGFMALIPIVVPSVSWAWPVRFFMQAFIFTCLDDLHFGAVTHAEEH